MITEKDVEHIAKLARIELTNEEKEKLAKEMGSILDYIDKLSEVNVVGVEPTAQVTGLENVFRKDETRSEYNAGEVSKLRETMPQREGDYLKVKAVFDK